MIYKYFSLDQTKQQENSIQKYYKYYIQEDTDEKLKNKH